MHTYLITGASKEKRNETIASYLTKWNVTPLDVITLSAQEGTIGIGEVRMFQKRLLLHPLSTLSVGLIRDAETLTIEAQNALLKLLEEPPTHAIIICETHTDELLLPTIVSRCELIHLTSSEAGTTQTEMQTLLLALLTQSPGTILKNLEPITTDRDSTKQWVDQATQTTRTMLRAFYADMRRAHHPQKLIQLLRSLIDAKRRLSVNCNPKIVLDSVFLRFYREARRVSRNITEPNRST